MDHNLSLLASLRLSMSFQLMNVAVKSCQIKSCLLVFSHIPAHYGTVSMPGQESSTGLFQIILQNKYMMLNYSPGW